MRLEQLPEELLLQIALQLPDSATPKHLKSLSLTSRKLRPIAQEALHTTARLAICCGCHPKVNAVVKLLRTLLDRPDLASKVKALRFRAVRKRVENLYAENGFDLLAFRDRCVSKLAELGYQPTHAWWRSINNCVESTFGGLLLALLPNLIHLDFWVKDHQRGPPSSECISGLWGSTVPPEVILHAWKSIQHLVTGDTSMLKCGILFDRLTVLDLRTVSIGTVLRLNGPGSLQGAESVTSLALTVSIQFADQPLVEKAEVEFSDLLDALACRTLKDLRIMLINDGYHIGDDLSTELSTGYFLEQLSSVQKSLESLSITLETTEEDGELDWLIDMCQHPIKSMKQFAVLKSLTIPQPFIFDGQTGNWSTDNNCQANELPPKLEQLELLYPHETVEEWVQGFLPWCFYSASAPVPSRGSDAGTQSLKKLTLTCREDVGNGIGIGHFIDEVDEIWWTLWKDYGIEAEVHDQQRDTKVNLGRLFEVQMGMDASETDDYDDDEDLDEPSVDEEDMDASSLNEVFMDENIDRDGGEDGHSRVPQGQSQWGSADPPCVHGAVPQTTTSTAGLVNTDETSILAFLRDAETHYLGRTAEQISMALELDVAQVDRVAEALLSKGHVEYRTGNSINRTLYFVRENEYMLEHDRLEDRPGNRYLLGGKAAWPQHKRPEAMACHRIEILRCLRNLPRPDIGTGLTESELNDKLNMEPGLTQDAMFVLLDARFIESHVDAGGSVRVRIIAESYELLEDDNRRRRAAIKGLTGNVPDGFWSQYCMSFDSSELPVETLMLDLIRSYQSEGLEPEGMLELEVSETLHIPPTKVTRAAACLLQEGYVRDKSGRYIFVRESKELQRMDSLKETFADAIAGWETDDSMPELEEY
nr:polyketide synthase 4 [Didymella macrostoma]